MAGATEDWTQAKAKGNQAYQAGNHLLAVEHFTTAIQLTPKDGDHQLHILYSNRSAARLNLGLAYEALADAKKCTEIQPAFAKGWSRVGAAMYRMGRYPEAVAAYTEGLVQAPGNADLTRALAEASHAAQEMRGPPRRDLLPHLRAFFLKDRLATRLFLPRVFMLLNGLIYLIPFLPAGWGLASYRRVLYTAAVLHLYALYNAHGFPKFTIDFLARCMQDVHASPLFLSLLLLSFRSKTYLPGVAALLLTEGMQVLCFLNQLLALARPAAEKALSARFMGLAMRYTQNPRYGALPTSQARWAALFTASASHAAALEIGTGLFLGLELLTPRRNIFGIFLFWQYLQMRYMLDQSGVVKGHFKRLDDFLLRLTSHPSCPAFLGRGYELLRGYLGRAVAIPDPQQQRRPPQGGGMPRCSVM